MKEDEILLLVCLGMVIQFIMVYLAISVGNKVKRRDDYSVLQIKLLIELAKKRVVSPEDMKKKLP